MKPFIAFTLILALLLPLLHLQTCAARDRFVSRDDPECIRMSIAPIAPACPQPAFTISPDGSLLATEHSSKRNIAIWDVSSGRLLSSVTPLTKDAERTLAFSSNSELLLISEAGVAVSSWDARTGKKLAKIGIPSKQLFSYPFSLDKDGKLLAVADNVAGELLLYSIETQKLSTRLRLDTGRRITALSFSSSDAMLVGLDSAGTVEGWNSDSGERIYHSDIARRLKADFRSFTGSLSPDGSFVLFLEHDTGILNIFESRSGREVFRREFNDEVLPMSNVALSPRGDLVAVPQANGASIRLVRIPSGDELGSISLPGLSAERLTFSDDGSILALCTGFRVRLFGVSTREELPVTRGEEMWWNAVFSENDEVLFLQGSNSLSAWNWQRKRKLWSASDTKFIAPWKDDLLATVHAKGAIDLRNNRTGKVKKILELPTWDGKSARTYFDPVQGEVSLSEAITSMSFSFQDNRVLYRIADRQIAVYSMETKQPTFLPTDSAYSCRSAELMAGSSNQILSVQDKRDEVFGGRSRLTVITLKEPDKLFTVESATFIEGAITSPDGKRLAAIDVPSSETQKGLKITWWKVGIDKPIGTTKISQWTIDPDVMMKRSSVPACYSPDGKFLLIGDSDGVVHIVNAEQFKEARSLKMHVGAITSLIYSHDGKSLAITGVDGVSICRGEQWQKVQQTIE